MEKLKVIDVLETLFNNSSVVDLALLLPFLIGVGGIVGAQIESTFMGEIDVILASDLLMQEKMLMLATFAASLIVTIISVVIIAEKLPLPINPIILQAAAGGGFVLSRITRTRKKRVLNTSNKPELQQNSDLH